MTLSPYAVLVIPNIITVIILVVNLAGSFQLTGGSKSNNIKNFEENYNMYFERTQNLSRVNTNDTVYKKYSLSNPDKYTYLISDYHSEGDLYNYFESNENITDFESEPVHTLIKYYKGYSGSLIGFFNNNGTNYVLDHTLVAYSYTSFFEPDQMFRFAEGENWILGFVDKQFYNEGTYEELEDGSVVLTCIQPNYTCGTYNKYEYTYEHEKGDKFITSLISVKMYRGSYSYYIDKKGKTIESFGELEDTVIERMPAGNVNYSDIEVFTEDGTTPWVNQTKWPEGYEGRDVDEGKPIKETLENALNNKYNLKIDDLLGSINRFDQDFCIVESPNEIYRKCYYYDYETNIVFFYDGIDEKAKASTMYTYSNKFYHANGYFDGVTPVLVDEYVRTNNTSTFTADANNSVEQTLNILGYNFNDSTIVNEELIKDADYKFSSNVSSYEGNPLELLGMNYEVKVENEDGSKTTYEMTLRFLVFAEEDHYIVKLIYWNRKKLGGQLKPYLYFGVSSSDYDFSKVEFDNSNYPNLVANIVK